MLRIVKTQESNLSSSPQNAAVSKVVVALLIAVVIGLAATMVVTAAPGLPAKFFRVIEEAFAIVFLLLIPGLLIGTMANQVRKRFRL